MRMPNRTRFLLGLALALAWAAAAGAVKTPPPYQPVIDPSRFQAKVDNPFFPLVPGTTFKLIERSSWGESENEITVTRETKEILGVKCVVVHDVEKVKGVVKEDTYDWYAQDKEGSVWYFGEATKEVHRDGKVSTEGSWKAGAKGAQPGIVMPGKPAVGDPYRQEYGPGVAEDMGQIVALGDSVTVPYGSFGGCLKTKEWSQLERGSEFKWYARGIGLVRSESAGGGEVAELVSVTRP